MELCLSTAYWVSKKNFYLQLHILCNDQSWLGKKPFDPDFGQYKGSKKYAEQVHSCNIETTGEMYDVYNTEYYKHQAAYYLGHIKY